MHWIFFDRGSKISPCLQWRAASSENRFPFLPIKKLIYIALAMLHYLPSFRSLLIMYLSFLNYLALFLLFFIIISFFYAIIGLCNIPYQITKKKNHPATGCHSNCRLAQFAYPANSMAFDMDLGNPLSRGSWMGIAASKRCRE